MKFLQGMLQKYEIVNEGISWFQQKSMSINNGEIDLKVVLARSSESLRIVRKHWEVRKDAQC